MKKYLIMIAVLLFVMTGSANAAWFIADPQVTDGAASVKISVHNDVANAVTLNTGEVVIWDIDASTGNNDLFVATTTTANTGLVAGVIWPTAIEAGNSGSMVVYGFAECEVGKGGVKAFGLLCTGATAGSGDGCTVVADEAQAYAIVTSVVQPKGQGVCFVTLR